MGSSGEAMQDQSRGEVRSAKLDSSPDLEEEKFHWRLNGLFCCSIQKQVSTHPGVQGCGNRQPFYFHCFKRFRGGRPDLHIHSDSAVMASDVVSACHCWLCEDVSGR